MQQGLLPEDIPSGAAQPRFLGHALYDAPNSPGYRDSFGSTSQRSIPAAGGGSEYGSVYALNDARGGGYRDDPSGRFQDEVPMSPVGHSRALNEKNDVYQPPRAKSRRNVMIIGSIVALLLIAAAVIVPVYFAVIKPRNSSAGSGSTSDGSHSSGSGNTHTSTGPSTPQNVLSGGDGSTITMEDGTTFTYRNKFGGYWYYDPNDPYSAGGKAQEWTPAINETFNYGVDKIRGYVFFSPSLLSREVN
jgi:glucan 1,3-beta-glucosidase